MYIGKILTLTGRTKVFSLKKDEHYEDLILLESSSRNSKRGEYYRISEAVRLAEHIRQAVKEVESETD